jgi:hypothetical protein
MKNTKTALEYSYEELIERVEIGKEIKKKTEELNELSKKAIEMGISVKILSESGLCDMEQGRLIASIMIE